MNYFTSFKAKFTRTKKILVFSGIERFLNKGI